MMEKLIGFISALNIPYEVGYRAVAATCDNEDHADQVMNSAKDNGLQSGVVKYMKKKVRVAVQLPD